MAVEYVGNEEIMIEDLTPFPGNAWHGDPARILTSLRANGQYRSVVVRRTDDDQHIILAGNHTTLALDLHGRGQCDTEREHRSGQGDTSPCGVCHDGWDGAPRCEVIRCDDQTAKRINLADNRLPTFGAYDDDALLALLGTLDTFEGSGYTPDDLDVLGQATAPPPSLDSLAEEYGEPDEKELWPVITFRLDPEVRSRFYDVTDECEDKTDAGRLLHLIIRAERS